MRNSKENLRPLWYKVLVTVILFIGIALRVYEYWQNRSFWADEASLGLNLLDGRPRDFIIPLRYAQTAPFLFLLVEKLIGHAFHYGEYALRFVPFISGVAAFLLFFFWSATLFDQPTRLLAILLFATSDPLLRYSAELKQYSTDLLVSQILLVTYTVVMRRSVSWASFGGFAVLCMAAQWLSQPAIFVEGGIIVAFIFSGSVAHKQRSFFGPLLALCVTANFLVYYSISLNASLQNASLNSYWSANFLPVPPLNKEELQLFSYCVFGVIHYFFAADIFAVLILFLMIVGAMHLWRRARDLACLMTVPLLLVSLASGLHKYPIAGRLLLFAYPLFCVLLCDGVMTLSQARLRAMRTFAAAISAGIVTATVVFQFLQYHSAGRPISEMRPLISYLSREKIEGDSIYVYYGSVPAFSFYTQRDSSIQQTWARGISSRDNPERYKTDLVEKCRPGRTWFVFSHVFGAGPQNEEAIIHAFLSAHATNLEEKHWNGASLYLFDIPPDLSKSL